MAAAGFGLFVLGIIFIIAAPISKKRNSRCSVQARGTWTDARETENSQGSTGNVYIYSYYVNGVEYQLRSTTPSEQAKNLGDACTIWYNPAKPKQAQVFHYDSAKPFRIILIIGIVMLLAGLLLTALGLGQ